MKRKILCLFLVLALAVLCVMPVSAAFNDTQGHWAEAEINRAVALGLFSGVSATEFAPNVAMDRAMVVSVLSRLAKISTAQWSSRTNFLTYKFTDVKKNAYYSEALAWAILHGIASGTSTTTFSPTAAVTREQLATMFCNYLDKEGYQLITTTTAPNFSDSSSISSWARDSVTRLARSGVIAGIDDGKGGVKFSPQKSATRAECAAMFCRLINVMQRSFAPSYATSVTLSSSKLTLDAGKSTTLTATLQPASATNKTVVWISSNTKVVRVDNSGKLTAVSAGKADIYAASDMAYSYCTVTVNGTAPGLASASMTYEQKCVFVFGHTLSGGENSGVWRTVYGSQSEAQSNQTYITVPVWTVTSSGQKVSGTRYFQVHKNLAATVQQIFKEIYESPDQPPISAVGGWRWRSYETSEHNMGTALDLSPDANPYVAAGGDAYSAGFRPGVNPYSIPIGGTIDQIFAKYGFKRGIYWNSGSKDYMHYSFFGW